MIPDNISTFTNLSDLIEQRQKLREDVIAAGEVPAVRRRRENWERTALNARAPGRSSTAAYYEMSYSQGIYSRTLLTREQAASKWETLEPSQRFFCSVKNEWYLCEDFNPDAISGDEDIPEAGSEDPPGNSGVSSVLDSNNALGSRTPAPSTPLSQMGLSPGWTLRTPDKGTEGTDSPVLNSTASVSHDVVVRSSTPGPPTILMGPVSPSRPTETSSPRGDEDAPWVAPERLLERDGGWNTSLARGPYLSGYTNCRATAYDLSGEWVLTSPNVDYVLPVDITVIGAYLFDGWHFGLDDPILFPQHFSEEFGHVSCIPLSTNELRIPLKFGGKCWVTFGDSDFLPDDPHSPNSLGAMSNDCQDNIRRIAGAAQEFIRGAHANGHPLRDDRMIRTLEDHLYNLIGRLADKGTRRQCSLLFMLGQRFFLELNARYDWLAVYLNRFHHEGRPYISSVRNIMGAYTDNSLHAEALYKAGIPVWLVRKRETVKVDTLYNWVSCGETNEWCKRLWTSDFAMKKDNGNAEVWKGSWFAPNRHRLTNVVISNTLMCNPWAAAALQEADDLQSAATSLQGHRQSEVGPSRSKMDNGT
jgi:hypothetical protein